MNKESAIARLLAGMQREPHDYRSSLQVFPDLDVKGIAAELDLERQGTERGTRNEPTTTSGTLDEIEVRIVERIEAEKKSAHGLLLDELQVYSERLTGLDFEGRFGVIRQAAPEAVGDLRAEAAQGRDELHRLRRDLKEKDQERDDFRRTHRIGRSARVVTAGSQALKIGFLALLLVVEVFINGNFLAKGNELGLLGGAVEAFTFAALNVLVSFFVGYLGVREINHRNVLRKLLGLVALAFYVSFTLSLNGALAHYREVSGVMTGDAGQEVIARLLASPFGLHDIKSWLFFAIGVAFSVGAFIDGIAFGDPYPGYDRIETRRQAAHEAYISRKADLIERLGDIRDEASEALQEANRDLSVRRSEHDAVLQSRARLVRLFDEHQAQLERAASALLTIYREANSRSRTTKPPKRFGQKYKLERYQADQELLRTSAREDLRRSIAENQALLMSHVERLQEEFEKAVSGYRQIDDMILEGSNEAARAEAA